MKRKVKLFATIASLCLSLALMAFGVYAATQVTYGLTSKVSFEAAPDIYLHVDTTKSKVESSKELYGTTVASDSEVWTALTDVNPEAWATYTKSGEEGSETLIPNVEADDGEWAIGELKFVNQTKGESGPVDPIYSYRITVVFVLDKTWVDAVDHDMTITFETPDSNVDVTCTYNGTGYATSNTVVKVADFKAATNEMAVVFTLRLKDPAVSVEATENNFNPVIKFNSTAKADAAS